ncbi:MAG: DUF2190 family protein [Planctomycetes bacterium]|nr:DUF2190 family protein [Planctomycetota bacterium]
MKARFIHDGLSIDYTPATDVAAGDVIELGEWIGIAKLDIAAGTLGALAVAGGVFDVQHAADAIEAHALVHWDADGDPVGGTAGTGAATATSTGNKAMGVCLVAATETDATVRILKLNSPAITNNHYGPLNNAIADPGDGEAIPVTASGFVNIVTAGAETRTLAAPTFDSQQLRLNLKTDGGDCVLTVASAVNATGNNTLTFAEEGDVIVLYAVDIDGTLAWRALANDGVALSTVE